MKLRSAHIGLTIVDKAKIARFVKPLNSELAGFERVHLELCIKYGKSIGNNQYQIEDVDSYQKENKNLRDIEIELPVSPVSETLLEAVDTALGKETPPKGFTPEELIALAPFVDLPKEDNDAPKPPLAAVK